MLYTRAWLSNERTGLLFDFATAWLLQNKILLPAASTLTRLIGEVRERASRRLWLRLALLPDSWQKTQLDGLLEIPEGQRISVLEEMRKGPVTISGRHLQTPWSDIPDCVFPVEFLRAACHPAAEFGPLCWNGFGGIHFKNA